MRGCGFIPGKAGIQALEILVVFKFLDARLRGHDELRHSLSRGRAYFRLFASSSKVSSYQK
jgi:hypothetical protein